MACGHFCAPRAAPARQVRYACGLGLRGHLPGVLLEQSPARAEASGGVAASSFAPASVDIDVQCERRQGVITTLDTALVPWHTFTGPSDGARREDRGLLGLTR